MSIPGVYLRPWPLIVVVVKLATEAPDIGVAA
jgi:hypothetical protein